MFLGHCVPHLECIQVVKNHHFFSQKLRLPRAQTNHTHHIDCRNYVGFSTVLLLPMPTKHSPFLCVRLVLKGTYCPRNTPSKKFIVPERHMIPEKTKGTVHAETYFFHPISRNGQLTDNNMEPSQCFSKSSELSL